MFEKLTAFITGIVMTVGSFFGIGPDQNQPPVDAPTIQEEESFGGFSPVGGTTYRLKTSVGTTDTTIVLSSFTVDGNAVTMSTLNTDIGYATLDPQSETRKEFVSFTTITQNADGSATLTGVSRGLAGSYPYTASSTLRKAHPGQSIFVLSDAPQVFNEYTRARSNETITGQWTFSTFPITPSTTPASATTSGMVELATGLEAASSTAFGATGFRLGLSTLISTSTAPSSGNVVPVTQADGNLDISFLPDSVGSSTVRIYAGTSTSWTTTWTKPSNLKYVKIEVIGGGGAGGGANGAPSFGVGGGAGGYSLKYLDTSTLSTSMTVIAGNYGVGVNETTGGNGGTSSFGGLATSTGGYGGVEATAVAVGSSGGVAVGGNINVNGATSSPIYATTVSGVGASSMYGSGGAAVVGDADGYAASGYGAGGGGGRDTGSDINTQGGDGAPGVVIITEYF